MQYAANVWNICDDSEDARIDAAISATRDFFHKMGIQTRLSEYGLDVDDIERIVTALESRGMIAIGETQSINPEAVRRILQAAI